MNLTSLKLNLCSSKDNINRIKRLATDWEKLFANHVSCKGLVCKTYNEYSKLNNKKTNIC